MKFSVVMPTKRIDQKLFERSIGSTIEALKLSGEDWEFFVVSDNVDLSGIKFPDNVRVIPSEGKGISAALNTGIKAASGEWIVRMDDDDYCHFDRFIKTSLKGDVNYTDGMVVDLSTERVIGDIDSRFDVSMLDNFNFIVHPTTIIKREVLLKYPYKSEFDGAEDLDMWLTLRDNGFKFNHSSFSGIHYSARAEQPNRDDITKKVYQAHNIQPCFDHKIGPINNVGENPRYILSEYNQTMSEKVVSFLDSMERMKIKMVCGLPTDVKSYNICAEIALNRMPLPRNYIIATDGSKSKLELFTQYFLTARYGSFKDEYDIIYVNPVLPSKDIVEHQEPTVVHISLSTTERNGVRTHISKLMAPKAGTSIWLDCFLSNKSETRIDNDVGTHVRIEEPTFSELQSAIDEAIKTLNIMLVAGDDKMLGFGNRVIYHFHNINLAKRMKPVCSESFLTVHCIPYRTSVLFGQKSLDDASQDFAVSGGEDRAVLDAVRNVDHVILLSMDSIKWGDTIRISKVYSYIPNYCKPNMSTKDTGVFYHYGTSGDAKGTQILKEMIETIGIPSNVKKLCIYGVPKGYIKTDDERVSFVNIGRAYEGTCLMLSPAEVSPYTVLEAVDVIARDAPGTNELVKPGLSYHCTAEDLYKAIEGHKFAVHDYNSCKSYKEWISSYTKLYTERSVF